MSLADIPTPQKTDYFITQTLKPAYYKLCARRQLIETINPMKHILKRYSDNFIIVVELTKACNIHYHGTITMRKDDALTNLCIIDDLKIIGNSKIEKIKHPEDIVKYLSKDLQITENLINKKKNHATHNKKLKIIYNHTSGALKRNIGPGTLCERIAPGPMLRDGPTPRTLDRSYVDFTINRRQTLDMGFEEEYEAIASQIAILE